MTEFTPADYSRCSGWPSCCLQGCKYAVLTDVYFCCAYNLRRFGQERVQVEIVPDRRPWWEQERGRKR